MKTERTIAEFIHADALEIARRVRMELVQKQPEFKWDRVWTDKRKNGVRSKLYSFRFSICGKHYQHAYQSLIDEYSNALQKQFAKSGWSVSLKCKFHKPYSYQSSFIAIHVAKSPSIPSIGLKELEILQRLLASEN